MRDGQLAWRRQIDHSLAALVQLGGAPERRLAPLERRVAAMETTLLRIRNELSVNLKVRLTTDLTRYHPSLRPGVEGFAIGPYGMWSRDSDRFTGVRFPQTTIDVLWSGLEVIDEEYLQAKEEERQQALREAAHAADVVRYVGPRGGFRYLFYRVPEPNGGRRDLRVYSQTRADELLGAMAAAGIAVREQTVDLHSASIPASNPPAPQAEVEPPSVPDELTEVRNPRAVRLPDSYPVPVPNSRRRPATLTRLCKLEAWLTYLLDQWSGGTPEAEAVVDTLNALQFELPRLPEHWEHPNLACGSPGAVTGTPQWSERSPPRPPCAPTSTACRFRVALSYARLLRICRNVAGI
jgi:hypothetical protein